MMNGLPVMATAVGATRQAMRRGGFGSAGPSRDAGPPAAAPLRPLEGWDRRAQMGTSERQRALDRFTEERMVMETAAIYERVPGGSEQASA